MFFLENKNKKEMILNNNHLPGMLKSVQLQFFQQNSVQ